MSRLPGIGGSLLPIGYLVEDVLAEASRGGVATASARRAAHFQKWWTEVTATCGPASGLRSLFDQVAMPLFGLLGFRARQARFERRHARATLDVHGIPATGLVLLPWAERPSAVWRDLVDVAEDAGTTWCFLLAPPFLSLVRAKGQSVRRSVDFTLPQAFQPSSLPVFWALAAADAFLPGSGTTPAASRVEAMVAGSAGYQDRVRGDLQHGVIQALSQLAGVMRSRSADARFAEALTLVYRVLFLMFAESRGLLPVGDPRYREAYAVGTLCRDALARQSSAGLWESLAAVTRLSRRGCRTDRLIVSAFNGRLFARRAAPTLERRRGTCGRGPEERRRDRAMQAALVALGSRPGRAGRSLLSYRDLGVEELGTVYERILDIEPDSLDRVSGPEHRAPTFAPGSGRHSDRRKQTGTFYTPQPLAEFVVRRTLAPLVAGRTPEDILSLRVVDPAMGSGAFLVAACRFLATAYERAAVADGRITPAELDDDRRATVRRLVAERCLAGVDCNPVAVQLARLSLWLTTMARGKPLGFLDHRLRVGHSLVGAAPGDLERSPTGRRRASASLPLFEHDRLEDALRIVAGPLLELRRRQDDSVADVRAKERLWEHLSSSHSALHPWRLAATVWCARWFWPPTDQGSPSPAETKALIDALLRTDRTLPAGHVSRRLAAARAADDTHAFFHWTLEFADVFYDDTGAPKRLPGFDAVIGNPPWEMLRHDSAPRHPAGLPGASGDRSALVRFIRESGLYPSCGRGHVNLYQPFLERALSLCRPGGQVGVVLPWGLAVDDGSARLRQRLLEQDGLHTIVGLDNAGALFPVHRGLRFVVAVASPGSPAATIRARFGVTSADELDALPGRDQDTDGRAYPVRLTACQIATVGGSTRRVPDVRDIADLALLERVMAAFPALGSPGGWNVTFGRELNATEDRGGFGDAGLPVVAGKDVQPFVVTPEPGADRITLAEARRRLPDGRFERPRLGYRDVSGVANRQSLIAAIVPAGVVTTHTVYCLREPVALVAQHFLCAIFNSFVMNAIVRMLMGGHVTTSLTEGLPVPAFGTNPRDRRIAALAMRLTRGPSDVVSARLEAEVARRYGVDAEEFARLLDGFPLVPAGAKARALRGLERRLGS